MEMRKRISITTQTTENNKTGSWRTQKPVVNQNKCGKKGHKCGLCWLFCPDASISISNNGTINIDYDYCKGCGICAEECPKKAIQMEMEE